MQKREFSLCSVVGSLPLGVFTLTDGSPVSVCWPTERDIDPITCCINAAFTEKHAWFKEKQRIDRSEIQATVDKQLAAAVNSSTSGFIMLRQHSIAPSSSNGSGSEQHDSPEEDASLVGVVHLDAHGTEPGSLFFGLLSCEKQFANTGFGTVLINDILPVIARGMDCDFISCHVVTEFEPLLNWYYTRCGMERVGIVGSFTHVRRRVPPT